MRDGNAWYVYCYCHKLLTVTITDNTSIPTHFPAKSAGCHSQRLQLARKMNPYAVPFPDMQILSLLS